MSVAAIAEPATELPVRFHDGEQPHDHQLEALDFTRQRAGSLLEVGMSGGKTVSAIAQLELDQAARTLILVPKNAIGVWPYEIRDRAQRPYVIWRGEVPGARGPLKNPSVARRAVAVVDATKRAHLSGTPLAVIVNYEAAWRGDMARILEGTPWDAIVLDEIHRIKSPGGKASRFAARLTARCRDRGGRVLGLTGTSMPHSAGDLYAQYRALDPSIFGTSAASFRLRYLDKKVKYIDQKSGEPVYLTGPKGEPIYDGLRPDRADEFYDRASRIMFRVDQETLDRKLGLKPPSDAFRECDLEAPTRRVYDQLERDLIAKIDDGVVTAANAMVLPLRLGQTTSGFARDADTNAERRLAERPEKAVLLEDLLQDIAPSEPVVVFCRFHHDLDQVERVAGTLGRSYAELSGRRVDALTEHARLQPGVQIAGVQLKSGGVGINLTAARYGVYYSVDWNLGDYLQSRKRLHRKGQERHTTFFHLLARDTIDWTCYRALLKRRDTVDAVLAHLTAKSNRKATP